MPPASLPELTLVGPFGAVEGNARNGIARSLAARGGPQHAWSARPNGGLGSGLVVVARWTVRLPKAQVRPTRVAQIVHLVHFQCLLRSNTKVYADSSAQSVLDLSNGKTAQICLRNEATL